MPRSLYSYLVDTQANIEALAVDEGAQGYATDKKIWGFYDGTDWVWGLMYGEIYVGDVNVGIGLAAQDTYYQLVVWSPGGPDGINGESNGMTPDVSNDHITISKDGMYYVRWHVSCYSAAKNEYEIEVFVNNGPAGTGYPNTEAYRTTSTASAVGLVAGGGICDLLAGDTVELWTERKDGLGVAKTLTVRQATLSVIQVGGT